MGNNNYKYINVKPVYIGITEEGNIELFGIIAGAPLDVAEAIKFHIQSLAHKYQNTPGQIERPTLVRNIYYGVVYDDDSNGLKNRQKIAIREGINYHENGNTNISFLPIGEKRKILINTFMGTITNEEEQYEEYEVTCKIVKLYPINDYIHKYPNKIIGGRPIEYQHFTKEECMKAIEKVKEGELLLSALDENINSFDEKAKARILVPNTKKDE